MTLRLEVGSKPAPGDLALIQAYVNTLEVDSGSDDLATEASAREFLALAGLGGEAEAGLDLERLVRVREAFRGLLLTNNGGSVDPAALATLNAEAEVAALAVRFDAAGTPRLEPSGPQAPIARLMAIAYQAMATGTWSRLKACREHTCEWAFYDHSKNRSGAWCSMEVCGNRTKARRYRSRSAKAPATEA